jgi:hypothetical protein
MAKKPATKTMQAAAKELNHILKPDPPIKYVAVKTTKIRSDLKAAATLLAPGDTVSEATADTLNLLGIEHKAKVQKVHPDKPKAKAKAKAKEKAKPKAKAKAKKKPDTAETQDGKSRYGHRAGTILAAFDDLLWDGCTLDEAIQLAVDDFDRDEKSARGYFRGHVRNLKLKQNIDVDIDDDGAFKARQESI